MTDFKSTEKQKKKTAHLELGRKGEELTVAYLKRKGFTILEQNWRVQHLEVDIIACKDEVLHFIEVKTRKKNSFIHARESLSYKKQKNLARAVEHWFSLNPQNSMPAQLDFIAISYSDVEYKGLCGKGGHEIEYYPNYTQQSAL